MPKVYEVRDYFNEIYPFYMKLSFDNIGLLAGFAETEVSRAVTALDITDEVIDEAAELGAQLIVSHHPLIFDAIKSVTDEEPRGRRIISLLTHGISAICLHTNLDTAVGGVNDALMHALGAHVTGLVSSHGSHPDGTDYGVSRFGEMDEEMDFFEFLKRTKAALHSNGLRYVSGGRPVKKLACCGGAGAVDMQKAFESGCDTYVTADLKYDHFLWARDVGLNLIDAYHFCTENVVVPVIKSALEARFPELEVFISKRHKQAIQFL